MDEDDVDSAAGWFRCERCGEVAESSYRSCPVCGTSVPDVLMDRQEDEEESEDE